MGNRRRAPHRRRAKARGPRKPGYAEVAICSAQISPKGPHGGIVWQPISGFLEQVRNYTAKHGATLGLYMERCTHEAIYAFKHRGLVLVDYKTNMMRMTVKGNDLIREVLAEIDESGETFATDFERFYAACALFKKALQPLKRHTKAELVSKLEILLGSSRTRDGSDLDTVSEGTDADSIMEDIDDAIVLDTSSTPEPIDEPIDNPVTPSHRVFSRLNLDSGATRNTIGVFNGSPISPIRKAASMGDPRFAYPSPESAPRLPLVPQGSLYYTPPPSPNRGAGHSDDILMEDEDEQSMDIDDNSLAPPDPNAGEDLQQIIRNLQQNIETLNAELCHVKASRQRLENTVETLQRQSSESEVMRDNLQSKISKLQVEMGNMGVLNQQLQDLVLKYRGKLKQVKGICAE